MPIDIGDFSKLKTYHDIMVKYISRSIALELGKGFRKWKYVVCNAGT